MKHYGLFLGLLLSSSFVARANLIPNGSFETGSYVANMFDTTGAAYGMSLGIGSTAIDGWQVVEGQIGWIPSGSGGIYSSDGHMYLDLTGWQDQPPYGGVVLQTALNTVAGQLYNLTFDIGGDVRWSGVPHIQVTVGTSSETFYGPTDGVSQWEHKQFQFVGSGSPTLISFEGEPPPPISYYFGLDNVTILDVGESAAAVPEPSTFMAGALLALPFGLRGLRHLRNRKQMK